MTRTRYPSKFKLRVVREAIEVGNTSEVARRYEIHTTVVGRWVRAYRRDEESAFDPLIRRAKQSRNSDTKTDARMREQDRLRHSLQTRPRRPYRPVFSSRPQHSLLCGLIIYRITFSESILN